MLLRSLRVVQLPVRIADLLPDALNNEGYASDEESIPDNEPAPSSPDSVSSRVHALLSACEDPPLSSSHIFTQSLDGFGQHGDDSTTPIAPPKPHKRGRKGKGKHELRPLSPPLTNSHAPKPSRSQRRNKLLASGARTFGYKLRSTLSKNKRTERVLQTTFSTSSMSWARGAWRGLRTQTHRAHASVAALLADGFKIVDWNGLDPVLLVDQDGYVFGYLAGRPVGDPTWKTNMEGMNVLAEKIAEAYAGRTMTDRRGSFPRIRFGVSYGGGQKAPRTLNLSSKEREFVRLIRNSPFARRIAHFMSSAFAWAAPKLFAEYEKDLGSLRTKLDLQWNFPRSVFPAATLNLPPYAVTDYHKDYANRAIGWCAIYAGGQFDSQTGGHLVLPELKLALRFPAGSVICIPSATLEHGNLPVATNERRFSFTQYAAGALFHYVKYDFKTSDQLKEENEDAWWELEAARGDRWRDQLELLSRVKDLHADGVGAGVVSMA